MKITFVLPYAGLAGGIRVIATYAERLQQRGHDVFVVSIPKTPLTFKQSVKSLLKGNGWPRSVQTEASHFEHVEVNHKILESVRPVTDADLPDADVVVATWWETAEWVARLSPSKGAKAYFLQHYEIHDYLPVDRVKATWRLPMHKITIAQWLVDLARIEYDDEDVSLVPNSVDTKHFFAEPRDRQPVFTVGMMYAEGGRAHWKGCDVSLSAVALASQEIPDLQLIAFGSCAPGTEFPLPHDTKYFRQPSPSQLRNIYASCDAWLFGSRVEGFGLPILEAMACRTPVIGTPVGAAPELLADGAGILVESDNPQAMADAIIRLSKLPNSAWRKRSDTAFIKATGYTWDDATSLFECALETAIKKATSQ